MHADADRFRPPQASTSQAPAPQPVPPADAYAAPTRPQYGPPPVSMTPSSTFPSPGGDAPLIHPAAAQASNVVPYGVPVYQAPGYMYAPQPSRGLSITALVLGLCSFIFAWVFVVVPIIGLVFGFIALRREPASRVMATVGLVGSALGLCFVLLLYVVPLAIGLLSFLSSF